MAASNDKIYLLLTTTDEVQIIRSPSKTSLKQLQELIGGYIETVDASYISSKFKEPSRKGFKWWIVCDEEGVMKNKSKNPFAIDHEMYGDIIVVQARNGSICGFPEKDLELIPERILKQIKK